MLAISAAAARASASDRARFSASSPAAALSGVARFAMAAAMTVPGSPRIASRSESTGPCRVSRTRSTSGSARPRTRIASSRTAKGRGPSGVS